MAPDKKTPSPAPPKPKEATPKPPSKDIVIVNGVPQTSLPHEPPGYVWR